VQGLGDRTKLTPLSTLDDDDRFITTNDYGFQSQVAEPTVRDLYLFGKQPVPDNPFTSDAEKALSPFCHAVVLDGDAPTVKNCKIFAFRGDAILVTNSPQEISRMPRIPRVQGNRISHCWTGIRASAPDTQVVGDRVASCRDYGRNEGYDAPRRRGTVRCVVLHLSH
jgi:hypothetical protein